MSTYRKRSLCASLNLSILSLNSLSSSAIRTVCHGRKTFGLAPPGVAQLSDLVLEGTSFSIKKQGTTVKRNEPYFVLCPGNCDNEGDGGQWLPVSESKEGKTHLRTIGQIFASRTGCSQRYLWV